MEEIVTFDNSIVTIEPNDSIYFPIQIQMPEEGYDGVLAGGISFQTVREDSESEGIGFLVGFTKVILLWQGESVEPDLVLHQVEVVSLKDEGILEGYGVAITPQEEDGYMLVFTGELQNIQAAFIHGVGITSRISNSSTGEVVFEEVRRDLQIVPNSTFNFHTFVDSELFSRDYYQVTYFIESDGGSWEFQSEVWVEGDSLEGLAEGRRALVMTYIIIFIVITLAVIIILRLWHKQLLIFR
jgi:hypothetical protein